MLSMKDSVLSFKNNPTTTQHWLSYLRNSWL